MRVTIVNTINEKRWPHHVIGLAHEAKKHGAQVHITGQNIRPKVNQPKTDVLCVGLYYDFPGNGFHSLDFAQEIIDSAKAGIAPPLIVVGGPQATADPKGTIEKNNPNIMVIGEGEIALAELTKKDFDPTRLNNSIVSVEQAGQTWIVEAKKPYNLDKLPLPSESPQELLEMINYLSASINASRGCKGACSFCGGAIKRISYMSAERVVAHIQDWLKFNKSIIHLQAANLASIAQKINSIIREITQTPDIQNLTYGFSATVNGMAKAFDAEFADQTPAFEIWKTFFSQNEVVIMPGLETLSAERLALGHLDKTNNPEKYLGDFKRLLESGVRVETTIIAVDAETRLEQIIYDYEQYVELAKEYANLVFSPFNPLPDLKPIPGTKAAKRFFQTDMTPKPFVDKRVEVLLNLFSETFTEIPAQGIGLGVAQLKNILNLLNSFKEKCPGPEVVPTFEDIEIMWVNFLIEWFRPK